ncbi:hypothetical protein L873DRAFT_1688691 [Choiromyces venosus 120613-1]|uniref:RA-domain-containing protein n=1 Tax=Choiromyces venosus 120613-1 TaxID=1336337 RepID=A0A3N4JIM1_9PEZI|nr:hypothetical protein L873DRAFT_1688691 [Choiromyces venosus 120613-1]
MPSPSHHQQPSSPTDSDIPSRDGDQHTPTFHQPHYHEMDNRDMSDRHIMEWDVEDVTGYIRSLGLDQYGDSFLDNEIDGQALVHLDHEELRDVGVQSVGHRLTILKNVYNIKIAHGVPIDTGDYVPVSADVEDTEKSATQHDIQRLIGIIRQRDERISQTEGELRELQKGITKLREELLPVWRRERDKRDRDRDREERDRERDQKLILGTPKNASPTHSTHPENVRAEYEPPPTATNGNAAITNLQNSQSPGNIPSPTSPSTIYHLSGTGVGNPLHNSTLSSMGAPVATHRPTDGQPPRTRPPRSDYEEPNPLSMPGNSSSSVEIFKSFRVSMEDPCYKVLPAALKRYNIQANWRQYALYIVHGDQERCLGLEEKPLILFKQLDREGRKPMFMLRRNGNFESGGSGSNGGGPSGGGVGGSGASVYGGREGGITLPGGVL